MLIQARYSPQDMRSLEKALASGDYPFELREALQVAINLKASFSKSEQSTSRLGRVGKSTRLPATKASLIAGVRKASAQRVLEIAKRLNIAIDGTRSDIQHAIEKKISSLSNKELEDFSVGPVAKSEADQAYIGLAEFILKNESQYGRPASDIEGPK